MYKKLLNWLRCRRLNPAGMPMSGGEQAPIADGAAGSAPQESSTPVSFPTRFCSPARRELYAIAALKGAGTSRRQQFAADDQGELDSSSNEAEDLRPFAQPIQFQSSGARGPSTFIIIGSDSAESIMAELSAAELGALVRWAQGRGAGRGSVDLARWPGWADACRRMNLSAGRAREISAALLARLKSSENL